VIANAARWASQPMGSVPDRGNREPLEPLSGR
jgi:hypothetical protein